MANAVRVRLDLDQTASLLQIADDRLAALEAVHTGIRPGVLAHRAVFFDRVDHGQLVPLADLEVDRVVAGRHLQRATAERLIDGIVGDDKQLPLDDRQDSPLADERPIAFVGRIHGYARVGHNRLRPGRRDRDRAVPIRKRVREMPQATLLVPMLHFQVGDRCLTAGAPVDEALATIDQAFLVQVVEDRAHGLRRALVHREALARPVGGRAEPLVLVENPRAAGVNELPDALQELLASDVVACESLLRQRTLDQRVNGDRRMVDARQPERRPATHPIPADQDVFDRIHQRMAHVQLAGQVRRRHDDRERLAITVCRREVAAILPHLVEAAFYGSRLVRLRHL